MLRYIFLIPKSLFNKRAHMHTSQVHNSILQNLIKQTICKIIFHVCKSTVNSGAWKKCMSQLKVEVKRWVELIRHCLTNYMIIMTMQHKVAMWKKPPKLEGQGHFSVHVSMQHKAGHVEKPPMCSKVKYALVLLKNTLTCRARTL